MQDLFRKYLHNQCSPEEVKKMLTYFVVAKNELFLRALIAESLEDVDGDEVKWTLALDDTFASIKKQLNRETGKQVHLKKKTWIWAATSVVCVVLALSI